MAGINVNQVELDLDEFDDFEQEIDALLGAEEGELGEGSEEANKEPFKAVTVEELDAVPPMPSTRSLFENLSSSAQGKGTANGSLPQRFVIVDMNHLIHRYEYGMQGNLSAQVEVEPAVFGYDIYENGALLERVDGSELDNRYGQGTANSMNVADQSPIPGTGLTAQKVIVKKAVREDMITKVPNGIIKSMARWTRNGKDILIITADRGGLKSRKALFQELYPSEATSKGTAGYKSSREGFPHHLQRPLAAMERVFREAGIPLVYRSDYEADDYIMALVQRAKELNSEIKIDIICNDADLLPLVDDQVSVFFSTRKATFPEKGELSKRKYTMVTPENYEEVVSGLSAFKSFKNGIPYNMLLLVKMLRGDKSDEIPQVKGMTPTRVSQIIERIQSTMDAETIDKVFRYGVDPYTLYKVLIKYVADEGGLLAITEANRLYREQKLAEGVESVEDLGVVNIFDSNWDILPEYQEVVAHHAKGTAKDGMGGLLDISYAMKNFMLMDLNTSLNGKREPLYPKRLPAPYNFVDLKRSAYRIFNINV